MKKITLLLVTTLGLCACMAQLPQRPSLPQVQLPIVGEETAMWNPADYEGKPVMIVFMGSWCPWCKRTMPAVMQAAQDFATDVFDAIFSLDEMPSRFPICPREPWLSRKTRYMGVKNYNVFYNVNEEQGNVTILRVFYNRRNI